MPWQAERVHQWLSGTGGILCGTEICRDGMSVEWTRRPSNVLNRCQRGLREDENSLARIVGMGDLGGAKTNVGQNRVKRQPDDVLVRPVLRCKSRPLGILCRNPHLPRPTLHLAAPMTEERQTRSPMYTFPRGCRRKVPNTVLHPETMESYRHVVLAKERSVG